MNATFTIPSNAFAKTFARWQAVTGRTAGDLLRESAGMLARYMASSTQPSRPTGNKTPKGGTKAEQQIGMGAISEDMQKLVRATAAGLIPRPARGHPGKFVLARSAKGERGSHLPSGDKAEGFAYLVNGERIFEDLQALNVFHRQNRNAKGRVVRTKRAVTKEPTRQAETAATQKKVGWAKSGWITAGRQISTVGFSGVPVWIQQAAPGTGVGQFSGARPFIRLTNGVDFSQDVLRPDVAADAVRGFMRSLEKSLKVQINHLLRTA